MLHKPDPLVLHKPDTTHAPTKTIHANSCLDPKGTQQQTQTTPEWRVQEHSDGDPEGNPVFTHLIDEIEAEDTKKDLERQLYEEQQEAKFIEEAINQEKVRII